MKVQASPNIAFIKYWGKLSENGDENRNLATNPSLSMTLSKATTMCEVRALSSTQTSSVFIQDASASSNDFLKVTDHLKRVCAYLNAPLNTAFEVNSHNNFPQGTGLASSASAFASLTLAGIGALVGQEELARLMIRAPHELSALARRGSGSACRSMGGPYMKWDGAYAETFDAPYKLKDTILIFSQQHKKIPSSEGHKSAQSSPTFGSRLKKLPARILAVEEALRARSLNKLGPLLEEEALELHHIARSGTPSITYLNAESQRLIEYLKTIKQRDFFFTLDAGPNVHLISETDILPEIQDVLAKTRLKCEIWQDEQGFGPSILGT